MASQPKADLPSQAGQAVGQAQVKKDEMMNNASGNTQTAMDMASQTAQSAKETLVQTGMQMKNMAQGAADAVKTTLGMNSTDNNPMSNQSRPSQPSTKI